MIRTLVLKNVRAATSTTYQFGQRNTLRGPNGIGKSTVKEALCLLFGGCDSRGNRAPVELIQDGAEGLSIVGETSKVRITRTLTRKKNGTLKLERGGQVNVLSQNQLDQLLGASPDLFLSSVLPGYFMRLPAHKKHAVLQEVLPKVDRRQLLEQLLGFPLSDEDLVLLPLQKRPDLIAATVATSRRETQRKIDFNMGRIQTLRTPAARVPKPERPPECDQLQRLESLGKAWEKYRYELKLRQQQLSSQKLVQEQNEHLREKRSRLANELAQQQETPLPVLPDFDAQIAQQIALRKELPPRPATLSLSEAPNCPACGQTVGLKHREKVQAQTVKALEAWEGEREKILAYNAGIDQEVQALKTQKRIAADEVQRIRTLNEKVRTRRAQLSAEIDAAVENPLPGVNSEPVVPEEEFNEAQYLQVKAVAGEYERRHTLFEHDQKKAVDQEAEAQRVEGETQPLLAAADRLARIEEALKTLPAYELKAQADALQLNGYHVAVGDDVTMLRAEPDGSWRGYVALSTGERMKADTSLALKFQQLMRRPAGFLFIDNADLVDDLPTDVPAQTFFAFVDKSLSTLRLEVQ